MLIIKRNGKTEEFKKEKITNAIVKAMKYGMGCIDKAIAIKISEDAESFFADGLIPTVNKVEKFVYDELISYGCKEVARAYEGYRAVQAFKRQTNTTDDSVIALVGGANDEVMNENSNKNATILPTQRDLIAGEISKDIARRRLLPAHIVQAHDDGTIHFHDMDYFLQSMFNCDLVNISDMLDNGTVINGKMVETPQSFQVACTVMLNI